MDVDSFVGMNHHNGSRAVRAPRMLFTVVFVAMGALPLMAQTDSAGQSLGCSSSGVTARAWLGGRAAPASDTSARGSGWRTTQPRLLDTTITLRIANETWTRDSLRAGVALGAAGSAAAGSAASWQACAGAAVLLGRVTATLRGVYGQIHLRFDGRALDSLGHGDTGPRQPDALKK